MFVTGVGEIDIEVDIIIILYAFFFFVMFTQTGCCLSLRSYPSPLSCSDHAQLRLSYGQPSF